MTSLGDIGCKTLLKQGGRNRKAKNIGLYPDCYYCVT